MICRTLLGATLAFVAASGANAQSVTIGYQLIYSPWIVSVAQEKFEEATGYDINWVKFDSGGKVITAMASGNVDIAVAGSSPIAAGVSSGIDMQLFWILEDIASAEALVVRDGSGIDPEDPQTLKGKKIGVPFVSTTHFHMLYALDVWQIPADEVNVLNMQPNDIAAAWERGDIDGAFVWDPALGRIKNSGEVMITSGELSAMGKATFDGMVVMKEFAEANQDFMAKFVKLMADADAVYRDNAADWTPESEEVKAVVGLIGGEPADVPPTLALYKFPILEEQISSKWLGGGAEGGAAKALRYTAEFLQAQGKIDSLLDDYGSVVTPAYAELAKSM